MLRTAIAVLPVLLLIVGAVALPPLARAESPAETFGDHCARCHGGGGKADSEISRTLKVRPLVHDAHLARLSAVQIADLVEEDPKHAGVVKLPRDTLEGAAAFVKQLAAQAE